MSNTPIAQIAVSTIKGTEKQNIYPKTIDKAVLTTDKEGNEDTLDNVLIKGSDAIEKKQDKLVSGTNIKTVNGQSLLGKGDVAITSGGSGGANIKVVDKMPDAIEPGTMYLIKSED